MGILEDIGGALGLRRKKTLADKVEDTAEKAVEVVRDAYSAALDTLSPVLERSGRVADVAGSRARRAYSATLDNVAPVLSRTTDVADRVADRTVSRARDAYTTGVETLEPVLEKSLKVAEQAWARTAKKTAAGISTAGDLAADAAATVGHTGKAAAATVSHTGKAAAGAVGGAAAATGTVFGTAFSWLWKTSVFLFKAALLAGVAYVGWQWLQSRREDQTWSMPGPTGAGYSSTSGTSTSTPSTTYGAVGSPAGAGTSGVH